MSAWRRKAIETLPQQKSFFEDPETSIYGVFTEMLAAAENAHTDRDTDTLKRIYSYAAWCFRQKNKDLWNAAGVSFYEHLCDHETVFASFTQWIEKDIYTRIRPLLAARISDEKIVRLDKFYR